MPGAGRAQTCDFGEGTQRGDVGPRQRRLQQLGQHGRQRCGAHPQNDPQPRQRLPRLRPRQAGQERGDDRIHGPAGTSAEQDAKGAARRLRVTMVIHA